MLNGRIYRAAFLPLLLALAIGGFSLRTPARPLTSTLAPDAFDGPRAFAELQSLAAQFPRRRPGSQGDETLAKHIAQTLEGLGGTAAGGFSVRSRRVKAQTIDGERTLTTIIARRPGITGGSPIVLLAHRDAAARGASAELSGTAVLLELARVLAASETQRPVIVVSTSGGSGGDAGAADFATHISGPVDGAIVLGDLAGAGAHGPFVAPFSDALGSAPGQLQSTVSTAIAREVGVDPGAPGTVSQLAHLTLPLAAGEQGPMIAHGTPAVLVQAGGERPPSPGRPVSAARLQSFGRAVLSTVYALDGSPDPRSGAAGGGLETAVPIQHKLLPEWALRLLVAALLLPPLFTLVDGLARLRRRRIGIGQWFPWALACAVPFLAAALFARLLGLSRALAAPPGPVPQAALPSGAVALETVLAPALVLVLAWLSFPIMLRRLGPRSAGLRASAGGRAGISSSSTDAAGPAMLLVLLGVAVVIWLFNPFTALLLVPALHLWLLLLSPGWRHGGGRTHRARALALVALGLAPLALLAAFYARQLGLDLGQATQAAVLLLAGGYFGIPGIVLWCVALGCLAAATLVALSPPPPLIADPADTGEGIAITVRGPMSYAGPGSLGGTESALRR